MKTFVQHKKQKANKLCNKCKTTDAKKQKNCEGEPQRERGEQDRLTLAEIEEIKNSNVNSGAHDSSKATKITKRILQHKPPTNE
jgi:hypothetical protein